MQLPMAMEFVIDEQDQAMSFPCTVDVNVLNCSDFEREIELDETVTLTQTIGIGGTFASETELNGTIALSVGCSGDGCEEYTAAEEVVVPCDSIGTFIGTYCSEHHNGLIVAKIFVAALEQ